MTDLLNEAIIVEPQEPANACVIWMHGLGADGTDFADCVPNLALPLQHRIRFVFPHAPSQPVTINGGYVMPAWYDIMGMDLGAAQDVKGIQRSQKLITDMVKQVIAQGIKSNRIMLIGFSQGGAMALYTGLRFQQPLAGVASLSAYLPLHETLPQEKEAANMKLPIFMGHGFADPVVSYALGEQSYAYLKTLGYPVQWHSYAMEHTVCLPELKTLGQWMGHLLVS